MQVPHFRFWMMGEGPLKMEKKQQLLYTDGHPKINFKIKQQGATC